ncbi:colicin E3-like toxin immunity protein [Pseudomonas sp. PGPR40]|uniref:colicin E3-like toxin immunity protein n=1 Tax=Pseudomonas sp. PGPR40 TaxID=2913476 RepID=UPI001EDA5197|nr:colicin E3-like toxin immunity protein [Pseudomonas sp. PGPR40]
MGLRIRLEWYDKTTEIGVGNELSNDFGGDGAVIEALGLPIKNNINNGGFDVSPHWIKILQPHFQHAIEFPVYDYQISFVYRDHW